MRSFCVTIEVIILISSNDSIFVLGVVKSFILVSHRERSCVIVALRYVIIASYSSLANSGGEFNYSPRPLKQSTVKV